MFVRVRRRLEVVREDEQGRLHPLVRTAAHSALLVYNKYMDTFADSEVYWIALGKYSFPFYTIKHPLQLVFIVMCPDLKLQWLQDNGFSNPQIDSIYQVVIDRFNSTYKTSSSVDAPMAELQLEEEEESEESISGITIPLLECANCFPFRTNGFRITGLCGRVPMSTQSRLIYGPNLFPGRWSSLQGGR